MTKNIKMGISLVLLVVVLSSMLIGCSSATSTSPAASATAVTTSAAVSTAAITIPPTTTQTATTRTITDFQGLSVTIPIPEKIQRVAILTSPPNIITFVLGVNDTMCATSNAIKSSVFLNNIYPRLKEITAVRASAGKVNIEALLQTNPDLCMGADIDLQPVDKGTKIPTLRCVENNAIAYPDQQKKEVRFFGEVYGKQERAEKYCTYIDNNVAAVKKAVSGLSDSQKLKVYVGFNADHLTTFGSSTFMDEWIQAAGCINAAHPVSTIGGSEGGLAAISMEQILSWNPEIMIIDTGAPEDVYKDPLWANIPAVKNKKVYMLPKGMFGWNRASTEPAALFPMWLAITAYPEKFPGASVQDELKKFYSQIILYNLTDADISLILTGK
jgi:iron complex transport system substrate-binding protein